MINQLKNLELIVGPKKQPGKIKAPCIGSFYFIFPFESTHLGTFPNPSSGRSRCASVAGGVRASLGLWDSCVAGRTFHGNRQREREKGHKGDAGISRKNSKGQPVVHTQRRNIRRFREGAKGVPTAGELMRFVVEMDSLPNLTTTTTCRDGIPILPS